VIDAAHQGRGIGRATMEAALDRFTRDGATNVALSYSPENEVARHLYRSMGFVETGEMEDDEIVARYRRG
jgi:diamine N-acetyltransferase